MTRKLRGLALSAASLSCVAMALIPCAHATVYFENTGTLSGWTGVSVGETGSVTEVSSPTYNGSTALRCYQIYNGADSTLHSEVSNGNTNIGRNGDNRYYGFAFRTTSDWTYATPGASISQLITTSPCGYQQTDMYQIYGTRLEVKRNWGDPCNQGYERLTIVDPISRGVWHRLVIHKLWKSDNTGVWEVWLDGSRRHSKSNIPTAFTGNLPYRWTIGLYAGFNSTSPQTRTVYVDHARITSSYSEADPASWGGGTGPTPTPTATPVPGTGFSGYYRLMARHSGKAVVVAGASTANGANVYQWSYNANTTRNDEWELRSIGGGYYRVINRGSGKDMNVSGASTANGADVIQWTYAAGAANSEWQPVSLGNGYYRIVARHSGKVLNVAGASTADTANVDQWSWANVNQQQFDIVSTP